MIQLQQFGAFTDGFYDTANQVHDWVARKAQPLFAADAVRKEAIDSPAAFEAYRAATRAHFLASIGGLPDTRTPLNVQETGRFERDGYVVRKLVYESLPAVYVTANLYLPARIEAPAAGYSHDGRRAAEIPAKAGTTNTFCRRNGAFVVPPSGGSDQSANCWPAAGVLMCCGHSAQGKAAPPYQKVCIDLVRAGFVVLIIDAPSSGEMLQCMEPGTATPLVGFNGPEHSHLQLPASILGQNIARYFIWNGIRGIDVLCSLPEVNPARIGVTGNSGGGCQTQYLMMTDPRIAAAMPCCSLSSRATYLATGVRAYDGEQNLFGCIRDGVDYDDFVTCFAPRPACIGAAAHDFFCIEGALQSYERARRVYAVLGARDHVALLVAENEHHSYSAPLRAGCVDWFRRHLQDRPPAPAANDPPVEAPETLQCTRSGQVLTEYPGARSIMDLNRTEWKRTRARRTHPPTPPTPDELAGALAIPDRSQPIRARRTSEETSGTASSERIFFFSEPDIALTAAVYQPLATPTGATLMLIPGGTEGQAAYQGEIEARVAAGRLVMVLDARGTGAVRMRKRTRRPTDGFESGGTEFRVASDLFMLGTSMLSARVFDVLRGFDALRARPDLPVDAPIELVAAEYMAIYGLFAAVIETGYSSCRFINMLSTYDSVFDTRRQYAPNVVSQATLAPELAGRWDIPDLLEAIRAHGNRTVELIRLHDNVLSINE